MLRCSSSSCGVLSAGLCCGDGLLLLFSFDSFVERNPLRASLLCAITIWATLTLVSFEVSIGVESKGQDKNPGWLMHRMQKACAQGWWTH